MTVVGSTSETILASPNSFQMKKIRKFMEENTLHHHSCYVQTFPSVFLFKLYLGGANANEDKGISFKSENSTLHHSW